MYICISASLVASFIVHCLTAESLYPASLRGEQSIGGDWLRLHNLYLLFSGCVTGCSIFFLHNQYCKKNFGAPRRVVYR